MTRHDVFRELDPPPGGLTALRSKLDARRRRSRAWAAVLAGPVLAAGVALLAVPRPAAVHFTAEQNPAILRLQGGTVSSAAAVIPGIDRADFALLQQGSTHDVEFYWMAGR